MRFPESLLCTVAALWMTAPPIPAQTTEGSVTEASSAVPAEAKFTAEELQKLVAPVALYPDTVLIQVLIAATAPLDVIMADRLLSDNPDTPSAELEAMIKAKEFDLSVEVLAIAFPDLIREMAVHIDWTQLVGEAMLVQSDDVMAAVQVMRSQAINTGALVSSPEVTVTSDPVTSTVVVQPADPEVVYVPQYDSTAVYSNPVGDALVTGLVVFGTVALMDEIFDDDDDWDDYWGCRNCADWDHGTVVRNPDVDIDVNGDVNIGNNVNIDKDKVNIDKDKVNIDKDKVNIDRDKAKIDRDREISADGKWKPGEDRAGAATRDLAGRREEGGAKLSGLERPTTRSDELRTKMGTRGDATDLGKTRDRGAATARPADLSAGSSKLSTRTSKADKVKAPSKKKAPSVESRKKKTASSGSRKPKIAKTSSGGKTKAASRRGASSSKKRRN